MTEDEAKTKWCPMARMGSTASHGTNRWVDGGEERASETLSPLANCIGSACMAWRWAEGLGRTRVHPAVVPTWKGWEVSDPTPDEQGYVEITKPQTDGFCGLAGAPQ